MNSFSQYGEDTLVASLFPDGFVGTVLEIGAWDPTDKSNSRKFIDDGWMAYLVEFSPTPLRNLLGAHGTNPRVTILAGAVDAFRQPADALTFRRFSITDDALSTDNAAVKEIWKEKGGYFGEMYVPLVPVGFFANIAADFVSIDTEGSSVDVLGGYLKALADRTPKQPKVICVEYDDRQSDVLAIAKAHGYTWVEHPPSAGTNMILLKSS
jgi:hypothetical protein